MNAAERLAEVTRRLSLIQTCADELDAEWGTLRKGGRALKDSTTAIRAQTDEIRRLLTAKS